MEATLAAPGGPDDETWKKMSRLEKGTYWSMISLIVGWLIYAFFVA
jgi:hypothetical protein